MKNEDFATRTFPARIAELGFSLSLPRDWISHELQEETPNFDDPAQLVALAVVTAPHAAIVLAVAARPAYAEGTLSDWGRWLLEKESASVRAMGEGSLGALPALVAEATKDSEVGTLVLRTAFAEDGSRLINATLTAPELFADTVLPVWRAALESFTLTAPRGSTVPVFPAATKPAELPAAEEAVRAEPKRKQKRKRARKDSESGPARWWTEAQALEAAGRIEEAIALIERECNVQGAIISQAELWARTMRRRLESGDRSGAREAWRRSSELAWAYAASATSGGEGVALSKERDAFLSELGPEPQ